MSQTSDMLNEAEGPGLAMGNARSKLDLVAQYSSGIPVARPHAAKDAPESEHGAGNEVGQLVLRHCGGACYRAYCGASIH